MLFRCICMYILASAIKLEVIRSIKNFALKMGGRGGGGGGSREDEGGVWNFQKWESYLKSGGS